MNEVTTIDEKSSEAVAVSPQAQIMQAIATIASDPSADIEKMERLMAMQERMEAKQYEAEFNSALSVVQGQLQPVVAQSYNKQTSSSYAKIEVIAKAARPILSEHGFSTTFREVPSAREGYVKICGELRHSSGHKEKYENDIPIDDKGIKSTVNKTAVHAHGSSLTYARRYCLMGMLDISITEDDDGNAGGGAHVESTVSSEQIDEITHLMSSEGVELTGFLSYHKLKSLSDLYAKDFDAACRQIKEAGKKRRANGEANG